MALFAVPKKVNKEKKPAKPTSKGKKGTQSIPKSTSTQKDMDIKQTVGQRRRQMLVHSHIYYRRNENIIEDTTWDKWAKELADLQEKYPELSQSVEWYDAFKDWDGSTGCHLPLGDPWVICKADQVMRWWKEENMRIDIY